MAKSTIRAADQAAAGRPAPHEDDTLSAVCLVGRHARCQGQVVTLAYLGPCSCGCHAVPVPAAWKGGDAA